MRTGEAFVLGAITGVVAVWLWGRDLERYLGEQTRGIRATAANVIQVVDEKMGQVLDAGGSSLRRPDGILLHTKDRVSTGSPSGAKRDLPSADLALSAIPSRDRVAGLPSTCMSAWSIHHISAVTLAVVDMATSVIFYETLGFDVAYGGADAPFTTMRAGQSVINLRQAPIRADNPQNRVILRVRGVDALHRDLVGKGLAPTEPQDAEWGERYFELADPQGVVISFAELL